MAPNGPHPSRLLTTARLPKASVSTPATSGVNRKPIHADDASITKPIGSPWPEENTSRPQTSVTSTAPTSSMRT